MPPLHSSILLLFPFHLAQLFCFSSNFAALSPTLALDPLVCAAATMLSVWFMRLCLADFLQVSQWHLHWHFVTGLEILISYQDYKSGTSVWYVDHLEDKINKMYGIDLRMICHLLLGLYAEGRDQWFIWIWQANENLTMCFGLTFPQHFFVIVVCFCLVCSILINIGHNPEFQIKYVIIGHSCSQVRRNICKLGSCLRSCKWRKEKHLNLSGLLKNITEEYFLYVLLMSL